MRLLKQAYRKYCRDGARALVGSSFRFIGQSIGTSSLAKRKDELISSYSDTPFYLNVGGGQFVRDHWRVLDFYSDWYDYDERFIDYNVNLEDISKWPIKQNTVDMTSGIIASHDINRNHAFLELCSSVSSTVNVVKPFKIGGKGIFGFAIVGDAQRNSIITATDR